MRIAIHLTHPVVSCWNFGARHLSKLRRDLPDATAVVCATTADFLAELPRAQVVLVWTFEEEWLDHANQLRWIVTPAAGKDYFRIRPPSGVEIEYGSFHGEVMAETVLALMLAQARGLHLGFEMEARAGAPTRAWPRAELDRQARTLRGGHLVIVGFGRIGRWVGRLAKPFGMRVTGLRTTAAPPPDYFDEGDSQLPASRLDEVLPLADHLLLTLPGGPETDHLIDARRLALLPPHAFIYNVGRGNAIDESALIAALAAGRIAGAALDVYEKEPLREDSPLRSCPGVLLLPHAAAIAPSYLDLFVDEFVEKFRRRYG